MPKPFPEALSTPAPVTLQLPCVKGGVASTCAAQQKNHGHADFLRRGLFHTRGLSQEVFTRPLACRPSVLAGVVGRKYHDNLSCTPSASSKRRSRIQHEERIPTSTFRKHCPRGSALHKRHVHFAPVGRVLCGAALTKFFKTTEHYLSQLVGFASVCRTPNGSTGNTPARGDPEKKQNLVYELHSASRIEEANLPGCLGHCPTRASVRSFPLSQGGDTLDGGHLP